MTFLQKLLAIFIGLWGATTIIMFWIRYSQFKEDAESQGMEEKAI